MYVPYELNPSVSEMEILTAKKYKTYIFRMIRYFFMRKRPYDILRIVIRY